MAASVCVLDYRLSVADAQGVHIEQRQRVYWNPGTTPNGQRLPVTLAGGAFTALTVPSGAKAIAIILGGATSLVLKGVTGDTGVPIAPASNPITAFDLIMPLGAAPSIGILNNNTSSQTVEVIFL